MSAVDAESGVPRMRADLAGKVALVTGGTRGLGRRMVSALAASGADVVVTSRDEAVCRDVAEQVAKESGRRTLARTVSPRPLA